MQKTVQKISREITIEKQQQKNSNRKPVTEKQQQRNSSRETTAEKKAAAINSRVKIIVEETVLKRVQESCYVIKFLYY